MKVAILGAKGMLGSALVNEFTGKHEVMALSRDEFDISSAESIAKVLTSDIDVIVNAAGWTDIDAAEADPDRAMINNAKPIAALADIADIMGMTLVHFSSEHVFSGRGSNGNSESEKTEPLSVFGRAKEQAEQFALEDNGKTYLIRTSRLFGAPGTSENAKQSFVDEILQKAQGEGKVSAVHDEVASPTFAPDLARAVREIIETKKPYGIYHIVNVGTATWYQLAAKVVELAGLKAEVNAIARRDEPLAAPRPRYGMLLNTKLPQLRKWEEALQEYVKSL
jgi:dTDP-4-dehydrorhamnose reductase